MLSELADLCETPPPGSCAGWMLRSIMEFFRRSPHARAAFQLLVALAPVGFVGCASPGSPRPPSLQLPQSPRDLSALRSGDVVEIRFTVPTRTSDGQPLHAIPLTGSLCRQLGTGPCEPVDETETRKPLPHAHPADHGAPAALWTDSLTAALRTGPPRPIAYRVELRNNAGHSAGYSDPVYVAGGSAPAAVADLKAQGTRPGVLLRWAAADGEGELLLERTQLADAPAGAAASRDKAKKATKAGEVTWLQADPGNVSAAQTIDNSAEEGVPYRYRAFRRVQTRVGVRTLELRSAASEPVEVTWRDIYPPTVPAGLTALGFSLPANTGQQAGYAVDLVWQPVNDPRLAGYLVYRLRLETPGAARERLTPQPIVTPAFHDDQAVASGHYLYEVTAIDPKGNESAPAKAEVGPQTP